MGKTVKAMMTQWLPFLSTKKDRRASAASGSSSTATGRDSPACSSSKQDRVELSNNTVYDEKVLWFPAKRELPILMNTIEDDTDCILCCDVMLDPVTLPCGHSVCQVCLAKAYISSHHHSLCPVCRLQWSTVPPINYCLRSVIEKLFPRKLAQRRAKSNTWGTADADVMQEFERCMRTRAVLNDDVAYAARFRLALVCLGILTGLCILGLLVSLVHVIFTQTEPPTVDFESDNGFMASSFASAPSFLDLPGEKNYLRRTAKAERLRAVRSALDRNGIGSDDSVDFSLADRFIQRNWLPHGRIDQWTTSEVVKFLKNAGLVHGASAQLQQRVETLSINGSTLLELREYDVWHPNGLNVTQPGTYHAFMMMIYGLRNLLANHDDPLTTFCARGAVNCVYIMLSYYAAPHLFWLYAFFFQYNRYFWALINSPQCDSVLSNWLTSLLYFLPTNTSAACSSTERVAGFGWQNLFTALMFPRFSMITVLVEHYRGHSLTFAIWAVIFIGTCKLWKSAYVQCVRLVVELPRVGVSETIGRTLASFARKAALVFIVTLSAWLIPVLCYPIIYAATSYELIKILLKFVLFTEKLVRNLLSSSRTERVVEAVAHNNNNNLMQVAENPVDAQVDNNTGNSSQSPSVNVVRRLSSSQLVVPSRDADILTRLGILNQRDQLPANSSRQRTPVRQTLSNISRTSSSILQEIESNGGSVNTLRYTVRQSRANFVCR